MENFPMNCGIGVIGDFEHVNRFNYASVEAFQAMFNDTLTQEQKRIKGELDYDQSGDKEDDNGDMPDPKKVYIATTSERQTPAAQALKNLGFRALTSWRGNEGKITLWIKKAEA